MRSIKTLTLAAVFAAGTSVYGLAEEAAPDHIVTYEPVFGTYSATDPAAGYGSQTMTLVGSVVVPASPWIAQQFSTNRNAAIEQNFFLRVEAANTGSSSD